MSASTKLSLAVKALCYLASSYPDPRSSSQIAGVTGGNASKIRKLLAMLAQGDIVKSTKGAAGGFLLAKDPRNIHMQEVYCSIEDRKAFHLDVHRNTSEGEAFTARFDDFFLGLFADIQIHIEDKMRKITMATLMDRIGIDNGYGAD